MVTVDGAWSVWKCLVDRWIGLEGPGTAVLVTFTLCNLYHCSVE